MASGMKPTELATYLAVQKQKEEANQSKKYSILKTEIASDPQGVGYLTAVDRESTDKIADNQKIADCLNDVTNGDGEIDRTESISFAELKPHINIGELAGLSESERTSLLVLYEGCSVDITNQVVLAQFKDLFGANSKTMLTIQALQKRPASRGELLGYGKAIKYWDVARARGLGNGK